MQKWHWIALAVGLVALFMLKDKLPNLVGHPSAANPLVGRWDQGGAIEFSVPYERFDYFTKKKRSAWMSWN